MHIKWILIDIPIKKTHDMLIKKVHDIPIKKEEVGNYCCCDISMRNIDSAD